MQRKSAPLTQSSVAAERSQLTQDRGGYYWKCWMGVRASNFKEWLPMETYGKACSCNQPLQKYRQKDQKCTHTHTHARHYGHTVISTIKFGSAVHINALKKDAHL